MKRASLFVFACVASCTNALPPQGQVLLFVDTDALLPAAPGQVATAPALFDRLRVEVFASGESLPCEGCTREFAINQQQVGKAQASFAILNPAQKMGVRARLRLYRTTGGFVVEPRVTSTLESVVLLPDVGAEGVVSVHVLLATESVGSPQGTLDAPLAALPGPAKGGLAGMWASAYRVPCADAPQAAESCIPGGAYWMGDPTNISFPSERLVALSPFFVSNHEITVGELRARGVATSTDPSRPSGSDHCTYTDLLGPNESLPVNCVSRKRAAAYCATLGAALISEAQWEYLARGLRSAAFPWGDDEPACKDAVFARGKVGDTCASLGVGPAPAGVGTRDRVDDVVDVAGNVAEWVVDEWAADDESCWNQPLLYDPVCTQAGKKDGPSLGLRGGHWSDIGALLRGAYRQRVPTSGVTVSDTVGFRCARPGK